MASAPLLILLLGAGGSSFEGQTVASVRIEAPGGDATRFEGQLEVKAGQPLRSSDLRHVVEVLYATGGLEDVVVEAEHGPSGLEVVFRLLPAPFLAGVRIEGDRVLTPADLRKVTRLRGREPLWPARLERAGRDAALHLAREGYLEARVTAAAARVAGGAEAVFTVHAGPRARVGELRIEGVAAAVATGLRSLANPGLGEVYSREAAQRSAERMRRRLAAEGRWRASVEVREAYDPARSRVSLVFVAEPGPMTSVEFRGDRPSARVRGAVRDLLRDGGLKGDVVEEATDRIEEEFRVRGHRDVAVTHHGETRGLHEALVFETRGGPQARVVSIRIEGAPGVLERVLRTRVAAPLEDRLTQEDARALVRALEEDGHAEAKVEAEVGEGGGDLAVVFRARPGPRTLVGAFEVSTPVTLEDEAPRELRTREGRPYRARNLALDRNDLVAAYRNAGYLQAEVAPEVVFSEDRSEARIVLRLTPGPRTTVDHIVISGLERTREAVVRRELLVQEGQPLGLQKVLESQRRLGSLGIFQRLTLTEMDPESVERRSLVVTAEEAPRTTVAYGIGYAERDRARGSIEVTRRNLSGMDRSVSLFLRGSFKGNRVLTTYREPYLFGRRQEFLVTGFREEEERETFSFVRFGALLQAARALTPRLSLIARYAHQQTRVFGLEVPLEEVDRQFRSSTVSGPSLSLVNDTRDDPLDPRRGRFLGADVQFSHRVFGGDSFVKGFLQSAAYRRLDSRTTLALGARLGLARTLGVGVPVRLPLPDRFFAGGDYSLRGFKLDTAGPLELGTSGLLFPTGGNALLLGGAELRVDLGHHLGLAAFSEAGNAYRLASDVDLGNVRYTAGAGLRYKSALGPIRIDWGHKLNRRTGETPDHFHFTIGHAF